MQLTTTEFILTIVAALQVVLLALLFVAWNIFLVTREHVSDDEEKQIRIIHETIRETRCLPGSKPREAYIGPLFPGADESKIKDVLELETGFSDWSNQVCKQQSPHFMRDIHDGGFGRENWDDRSYDYIRFSDQRILLETSIDVIKRFLKPNAILCIWGSDSSNDLELTKLLEAADFEQLHWDGVAKGFCFLFQAKRK